MMGEHIYRLKTSEMTHVRIICKACRTATDVDIHRVGRSPTDCGVCGHMLLPDRRLLVALQGWLTGLEKEPDVEIEFPLQLAPPA